MKNWLLDIPFILRIRKVAGEYFLRKDMRIRTREVQGMGLDSARSIGIIFNAKDERTFKLIREFSDKLRGGGLRKVQALGYVPKGDVASFLQSSQDFDFFTREDFNWYYKPQGRKVVAFMSEPFDILIDLRLNKFISLLFIVGLSRAHFKVGRLGKGYEEFYDLMIDVEANSDVAYFIEQIQHYLKMLESGKK
ncbi:MAG: hypothetical protein K9G41_04070 [Flavobacteriales bacterium]|nr:hypothetical protein [Flavobacteriales bacterium]